MRDFNVEKLMVNEELGHLLAKTMPYFAAGRAGKAPDFRSSGIVLDKAAG